MNKTFQMFLNYPLEYSPERLKLFSTKSQMLFYINDVNIA